MSFFLIANIYILTLLAVLFSCYGILICGLIGLLLLVSIVKFTNSKSIYFHLLVLIIISILIVLVMYIGLTLKYDAPYYLGGSDDLFFEKSAEYILQKGYLSIVQVYKDPKFLFDNSKGFSWIISLAMRLSGGPDNYNTMVFRVINVYILISLGVLLYSYLHIRFNNKHYSNVLLLYIFILFPNIQYINTFVFRDTLATFLLFFIFFSWNKYFKNSKKTNSLILIVTTLIASFVLFIIRSQNLIFILVTILSTWILKEDSISGKNIIRILLVSIIIGILVSRSNVIIQFWHYYQGYSKYLINTNDGISQKIFSLSLFPLGLILRIFFGLITPFPAGIFEFPFILTDIDVFFNFLISIGTIVQVVFLPFLFLNFKKIDVITTIFFFFLLVTVSTTFTFRHFMLIYPFMFIMIFRQFIFKSYKYKIIALFISTILLLFPSIVYIILKAQY